MLLFMAGDSETINASMHGCRLILALGLHLPFPHTTHTRGSSANTPMHTSHADAQLWPALHGLTFLPRALPTDARPEIVPSIRGHRAYLSNAKSGALPQHSDDHPKYADERRWQLEQVVQPQAAGY